MSEPTLARLRAVHRWLGLAFAIPLLLQGASGFILAIAPVIEAARELSFAVAAGGPSHGIGAIIAAARAEAPAELVPLRFQPALAPRGPAIVDLARPMHRDVEVRVAIDPVSLAMVDWRERPDAFYAAVHRLHETFLLPSGRAVVGCFGVGLLSLSIIGILIWWPRTGRWKAAFTIPWAARGYRLHRGLHGAAGGWVAVLLIAQSVTGASMAFPGFFATVLGAPGTRPPIARTKPAGASNGVDLDAFEASMRTALPGAVLTSLRFPSQPNRPLIATFATDGEANGAPPVIVLADAADGHIVQVRDPRAAGPGAELIAWMRAVHSGDGLGAVWRGALCILGLVLAILPVTGVAMWLSRRNPRRVRPADQMKPRGATE